MVFDKVKELIVKELGADPSAITLETRLAEDLGADSLDAVELIMAIEDEFGVEVDEEQAVNIKQVGDIVKYLEESL